MAYQLVKYVLQKKNVLLIDLDFMNDPNIILIQTKVEEGIDIIPLHSSLDLITDILVTKANTELLLFMWFVKNMSKLAL